MGYRSSEDDPEDPFSDPLEELPDEDYENLVPQAKGHRTDLIRPRKPLPRTIRPRTIPDSDVLKEIEESIRRLYEREDISVVAGREYFKPGIKEKLEELRNRRNVLWRKLGPTRLLSGTVYELWLNGKAYVFAPYVKWMVEFWASCSSTMSLSQRPLSRRDHLIWFLWHFRDRAKVEIGRTPHKVRGGLAKCVKCGKEDRYLGRPRNQKGVTTCRQCGNPTYQRIQGEIPTKPFGPISKAALRRRFRISRPYLEKILSVTPKN